MLHCSCIWRAKRDLNPILSFIRGLRNQYAFRNYTKSSQKLFWKKWRCLANAASFLLLLIAPTTTPIIAGPWVMMLGIILVRLAVSRSFVNLAVDVLDRLFETGHRLANLRNAYAVAHKVTPYVKDLKQRVLSIIYIYRCIFYNELCGIYKYRTLRIIQFKY